MGELGQPHSWTGWRLVRAEVIRANPTVGLVGENSPALVRAQVGPLSCQLSILTAVTAAPLSPVVSSVVNNTSNLIIVITIIKIEAYPMKGSAFQLVMICRCHSSKTSSFARSVWRWRTWGEAPELDSPTDSENCRESFLP